MLGDAVNNSRKQLGRPFKPGASGNPRGRPKGSRNKRTQAVLEAAKAGGQLPLDYMLSVMRDPKVPAKRRDEMAKAAAPYLHSRLSAVAHSGPQGDETNGSPIDQHLRIEFISPKPQPDDDDRP